MTHLFLCPSCGAPLDADGESETIRCQHCNNSVIVPPELRHPGPQMPTVFSDMFNLDKIKRFQEMSRLARSGQTSEAAALFQELTGVSEEVARQSIEAMLSSRPVLLSQSTFTENLNPTTQISFSTSRGTATYGGSGKLLGCVIGLIVAVSIGIPLVATMVALVSDGPLTPLWNQINPMGYARVVMSFGSEGTGPGFLTDPRAITVDPNSGNIFVAGYDNGRIESFDPNGKFLFQWLIEDIKKPAINGLAAGRNGNIYVAMAAHPIEIFQASTGKLVGILRFDDDYNSFQSVFALPDGGVLAVVDEETIVRYNADGQIVMTIPAAVSAVSDDSELEGRAVASGLGELYILGSFNYSVFHYSAQGKYINRFGGEGDAPGQLGLGTNSIAIDSQGRIYIADGVDIKVFAPDGRYLDVIHFQDAIFGMVFDDQDNLFVVTNKPEIQKLVLQKKS
jgi:DNA-binding beta-propeller fold protein YncE/DNA-directed RNA polymerase subunit RPC12/RpoP